MADSFVNDTGLGRIWGKIKEALAGKAPLSHTHTKNQITDFPSSMPASDVYEWAKASTKPSYSTSEISGLQSALDGKAASSHTHTKSQITDFPTLATVATSGSYNDLSGKPSLATVATSGSYNDLSNKPTIPSKTSQLTNDSGFLTSVPSHNHSADNITSGTLPASRGGTGQTSLEAACNALINSLDYGASTPLGSDYYVSQYAGGGESNNTYYRRPVSKIYEYIKSQAANSSTGFGTIYASGFYVSSLRSLKENIEPTKVKAVDLINSQEIVDFNYKSDEDKAHKIGLIADDSDPLFLDKKGETVDLYSTCGILMKAVQELSDKVTNLENKLAKI